MQSSRISVVIPTFSEEKYIGKTLSSLSKAKNLEIIVVDSGSTDGTVKVARQFAPRVCQMRERGISKAKNYGAKHANCDIVVFVDADVIVPIDFEEKVRNAFKDDVVGATCHILPMNSSLREQIFLVTHNIIDKLLLCSPLSVLRHARGEFLAVKKKAFMTIGGFNKDMPCFEDHDLTVRLSRIGKFVFINNLTVYESMRRIRKWGITKTLNIWTLNFLAYLIKHKTYSQTWTPIR
jgi:glycosyltransferase involved in cell wall biosynthesis